jgi:hypothetical protein
MIVGAVLHTGSTPLAARASVLSIVSTCHPLRALTVRFPIQFYEYSDLVLPTDHASIPYSTKGSTQEVTAFGSDDAGRPSTIRASPRM